MDLRNTVLEELLYGHRQAEAMAQRAQALQADATFWEPGEEIDKHMHVPLWRVICAVKGVNPEHWALSSPDQARTMQHHTTGDVSELLKEIVRLHDKADGHAQAGGLKGFGDTAKNFKTTLQDLIEWAEKVGEMRPVQCHVPVAQSTSNGLKAAKVHTTKDTRRDILTPVIEHAQRLCKDQWDVSEVWGQLHKLAGVQYLVLLHVEGSSIAYTDGDETKFLKRKGLADRIRRQKNKAAL